MNRDVRVFEIVAGLDEQGDPEELVADLYPMIPSKKYMHLGDGGLPEIGTPILPGMILVGRRGKTKDYDPAKRPYAFEMQCRSRYYVMKKYGHMYYDRSAYADEQHAGVVKSARIEVRDGVEVAIIEVA